MITRKCLWTLLFVTLLIFASCQKTPGPGPDPQPEPTPTPHHNTTYVWGVNNWDNVWPEKTKNVSNSADSTLVDNVYLKNDGVSFNGMLTRDIMDRMNTIIQSVKSDKRGKIHGTGTLNGAGIAGEKDVTDSTKLVEMGFTFANAQHSHNTYYIFGVNNWDNIAPEKTDNVAKSADSTLVNNVFLKNDGVSFDGMLARDILARINPVIGSVPSVNRHKVRGTGTLNGAGIAEEKDVTDSTKLAELGFAFANAIHPHTTTYVWGAGNWNNVWPEYTDNVAKSADSLMVKTIYLKNDGNSLNGMFTHTLLNYMNTIVESASPENRAKIRGAGTLNGTGIGSKQDVQDSVKLSQFGFSFGKVRYGDFER